ncbi:class I poly(R)-hydroxyalkanoic acid synthase [Marinobacteraceae bacterium S3BR75-40.1]
MDSLPRLPKQYLEHAGALFNASRDALKKSVDPAQAPTVDNSFLMNVSSALAGAWREAAINPSKLFQDNLELSQTYWRLGMNIMSKAMGQDVEPVVAPESSDHRFDDSAWQENAFYYAIAQAYLVNADYAQKLMDDLDGLSERNRLQLNFMMRQVINAMAPTNFFITNPEAVRRFRETRGLSLIKGVENFLRDIRRSRRLLNISMTRDEAFKVGENVAVTPGKVVFENPLIQLIQYSPTTETVHQTPLLIVPPFINKYYIMDLTRKKSLVRWLVEQGHTVFMISWVNPDASYRDTTFDDYVTQGVLAAMDAVEKATGEKELNTIGYCVGGTLLGTTLAHLAKKGEEKRVKSATFLASLLDFGDPGEIGVYINEHIFRAMEAYIDKLGYYDGRLIAFSFNTLRENNLFWSFFVNNYLKGEQPIPFDLLYWNSDSTNMPAAMYKYYLREMYMKNQLREPDALEIAGTPIDLRRIKTPALFVSTQEDHIARWKSTYPGYRLLSGPKQFLLGQSGHIAGIINPPESHKYGYFLSDADTDSPEEWFQQAERHDGSWWPYWDEWNAPYRGKEVPARIPGDGELDVIEDAPGRYVQRRLF